MNTPITYYGGKQRLAKLIISMMPKHQLYCEPFFGGGAVFFAKGPSPVEVINDHDDKLMTFYHQVQNNFYQLQEKVRKSLHSESEWLKARRIYYGGGNFSDLEVAWAVWMLTNMSYSASPNCGWKWDNKGSTAHSIDVKRNAFTEQLRQRLSLVQISSRDAITVIEQRDTEETFFYLDPPYVGCQQQHYAGYSAEDFDILLTTLSMLKGKFILSHFMNDQLSSAIYKCNWNVKVVESMMTVANNCRSELRKKQEILVYNYNLEPKLFE